MTGEKNLAGKTGPTIGIIGGSGVYYSGIFGTGKTIKVKTPFSRSPVSVKKGDFYYFLPRHGKGIQFPPHKINYRANLFALKKLGVSNIFAFSSTGSLKRELKPGNFLIPSDFMDFDPPTFYEKNPKFITPALSQKLRRILIKISRESKIGAREGGIYFNTKGPRLETRAEIKMISKFADVVGMTMANEATLANELGLDYAAICSVDNYANGVISESLDEEKIKKNQKKNSEIIKKIISEISKIRL